MWLASINTLAYLYDGVNYDSKKVLWYGLLDTSKWHFQVDTLFQGARAIKHFPKFYTLAKENITSLV